MPSIREMRLRIRSVKNISQVTRALQAVSASKVRRAMQAVAATQPYADKAWSVLCDLARQPGHNSLHPLLTERDKVENVLVVLISSDRGLAGSSNVQIFRSAVDHFASFTQPVAYVGVGQKGRDMLMRSRQKVVADFSDLPSPPTFMEVSAIGHFAVDEYMKGSFDQVYLAYNQFVNMISQRPVIQKLLPMELDISETEQSAEAVGSKAVFSYEPDQNEILNVVVPRFTSIQVYKAILSAQASEHAARMIAMRNATDNAMDLVEHLQLEYNKVRQQTITNELLDITGGVVALSQS